LPGSPEVPIQHLTTVGPHAHVHPMIYSCALLSWRDPGWCCTTHSDSIAAYCQESPLVFDRRVLTEVTRSCAVCLNRMLCLPIHDRFMDGQWDSANRCTHHQSLPTITTIATIPTYSYIDSSDITSGKQRHTSIQPPTFVNNGSRAKLAGIEFCGHESP